MKSGYTRCKDKSFKGPMGQSSYGPKLQILSQFSLWRDKQQFLFLSYNIFKAVIHRLRHFILALISEISV